tara:strand:- start:3591 stop:4919 length:1329 start_codon:yes stop_codon:yes gene_type:complete
MSTVIKHYRNSFIDITSDKIRILMDPWLYTANEGSWAASKNGDNYIFDSLKTKEVDYIYISHLHTDHFDLKFLKKLKKKQKKNFKIIIKKFKDNRLKNTLISNGFISKNIIDIPEYEIYKLKDQAKIIILPQVSSSNTPSEYIKYDLDTSCVFIDKNISLYNQVDNPYSLQDIKLVMKNLRKIIKTKFDLAFVPYCAASEFPQSFINLKRTSEKRNKINERIKKFLLVGKSIECLNIIPAGGSYRLDNIFSKLNKFLAIPNFNQIKSVFKRFNINKFNLIDSDESFFIANKHKIIFKKNDFNIHFKSVISKSKKNIGYNKIRTSFSKKKINDVLKKLESGMPDFKKILYDKTKTEIKINVWPTQPILINNLQNKKPYLEHKIIFKKKKKIKLKIHIYYKLLLGIVNNSISWNEVQNHCLYERRPNVYDPDAVFWMNLYKFPK